MRRFGCNGGRLDDIVVAAKCLFFSPSLLETGGVAVEVREWTKDVTPCLSGEGEQPQTSNL